MYCYQNWVQPKFKDLHLAEHIDTLEDAYVLAHIFA